MASMEGKAESEQGMSAQTRVFSWSVRAEIDVSVFKRPDGFHQACASLDQRTEPGHSIAAFATSRDPKDAAAFALIELGEALLKKGTR